jgi:hypothetical protein
LSDCSSDGDDAAVGVGDGLGAVVGVGDEIGVGVAVGVGAAVGIEEVSVGLTFDEPQAANIGTIKTGAMARTVSLYHGFLFGHMVNHLPYNFAKQQEASSAFAEPAPSTASNICFTNSSTASHTATNIRCDQAVLYSSLLAACQFLSFSPLLGLR